MHGVSPQDRKPKPTPLSFLLFELIAIQQNFAFVAHNKYQGPLLSLLHNLCAEVTPKYSQKILIVKDNIHMNVVKNSSKKRDSEYITLFK